MSLFNESVHKNAKTAFAVPTFEEVKRQFELKGVHDDSEPELFYAHYEANGWHVGRTKMRSWRAAVAGWVLRSKQFNRTPQKMTDADRVNFFYQAFKGNE